MLRIGLRSRFVASVATYCLPPRSVMLAAASLHLVLSAHLLSQQLADKLKKFTVQP